MLSSCWSDQKTALRRSMCRYKQRILPFNVRDVLQTNCGHRNVDFQSSVLITETVIPLFLKTASVRRPVRHVARGELQGCPYGLQLILTRNAHATFFTLPSAHCRGWRGNAFYGAANANNSQVISLCLSGFRLTINYILEHPWDLINLTRNIEVITTGLFEWSSVCRDSITHCKYTLCVYYQY